MVEQVCQTDDHDREQQAHGDAGSRRHGAKQVGDLSDGAVQKFHVLQALKF